MTKQIKSKISLKIINFFRSVGQLAQSRGEKAYAVGGFVRDLFLKKTSPDIDITIEGDGLAFAQALAAKTHSRVEAFTRFGTSIVIIPGLGKVDVATARTETYAQPGALPNVEKSGINQDLFRRDFTINAMALDLSPGSFLRLLDPYQGLLDLKKGRVRALHPLSFVDDPTRVFRAVRFEQRFNKHIEPETQKWLVDSVRQRSMNTVSGERLRNEFLLIFKEEHPERAVARLGKLGVLPMVHPALGLSNSSRRLLPEINKALQFFHDHKIHLDSPGMVWFQAMLLAPTPVQAEALAKRLMLSRDEQKIVIQHAKAYPGLLKEIASKKTTTSRIYRSLSPLPPEVQCFLLAAAPKAARKKMTDYFLKMKNLKPWLRGRDLKEFGIPPGFRYSYILLEALNGQLDGRFKSRKEVIQWVRQAFAPAG